MALHGLATAIHKILAQEAENSSLCPGPHPPLGLLLISMPWKVDLILG